MKEEKEAFVFWGWDLRLPKWGTNKEGRKDK